MSCLLRTWHLKIGLWVIHGQQLKAPLSLCPKDLMLKVKLCTPLLGPQALSVRKLCLRETPTGHLLLLALRVSFGVAVPATPEVAISGVVSSTHLQ